MKTGIKAFAAAAALLIFLTVCASGCAGSEGENISSAVSSDAASQSEPGTESRIKEVCLPYSASETFNPFSSRLKINFDLIPLVYPGLFSIDGDYNLVNELAESYSFNGNTLTVVLGKVYFSDGSAVTPADVVYSFNLARSSPAYSARFNYIISCSESAGGITFVLENDLENSIFLLDIPVVKSGVQAAVPVGAGRYSFDAAGKRLIKNIYHADKESILLEEITLVEISDDSSLLHMFNKKAVTAVNLDMSNATGQIKGGYEVKDYVTNYFVFMGFNHRAGVFKDSRMRQAVNKAVNRDELRDDGRNSLAVFTWQPANPTVNSIENYGLPSRIDSVTEVIALLGESGYGTEIDGYLVGGNKAVNLLVCSDDVFKKELAADIAAQLKKAGINTEVKTLPYAEYLQALEKGSFDIYLGETLMPPNYDVTACISGKLNYGGANITSLAAFLNTVVKQDDSVDAATLYLAESPIAALCYRKNSLVVSSGLEKLPLPAITSVYNGIWECADQ